MLFNVKLLLNESGFNINSLKANIANIKGNIDFNISIAHIDQFNNIQDFYNYCIKILNDKDVLLHIIKNEAGIRLQDVNTETENQQLKNSLINLVDKINENGLMINLNTD